MTIDNHSAIRVFGFTPDNQPPTAKETNHITKAVVCTECLDDLNSFVAELEKKDGTVGRNKPEDVRDPVAVEIYFDNTYRFCGAVETLRIFDILGTECQQDNANDISGNVPNIRIVR